METEIIKILQKNRTFGLDVFFGVFSYLASFIGFIFVFFIFLYINKNYAMFFMFCYFFIMFVNSIIKQIIKRPRPYEIDKQIINIIGEFGKSFPSGHIVSITIIITFLLYYICKNCKNKPTKIFSSMSAIMFVIFVAISRLYLGQHYITDIIAGIVFALIFVFIITVVFNKICKKLFKKIV